MIAVTSYLIVAIVYLFSLIGVLMKRKWGLIATSIIAAIDVISAFYLGGSFGLVAGIIDLALLFLVYKEISSKDFSKKVR